VIACDGRLRIARAVSASWAILIEVPPTLLALADEVIE
jgi:hypothetical protein